jgi:hypothetical protein
VSAGAPLLLLVTLWWLVGRSLLVQCVVLQGICEQVLAASKGLPAGGDALSCSCGVLLPGMMQSL